MGAPDDEAEKSHSFPGDWDTASSWSFLQAKMVGESSSDNEIHGFIRVSGGQHHGEQEEQEHRCHNGGLPPASVAGQGDRTRRLAHHLADDHDGDGDQERGHVQDDSPQAT